MRLIPGDHSLAPPISQGFFIILSCPRRNGSKLAQKKTHLTLLLSKTDGVTGSWYFEEQLPASELQCITCCEG